MFLLSELLKNVNARILNSSKNITVKSFTSDYSDAKDKLYIALNSDSNKLKLAIQGGAVAVLIQYYPPHFQENVVYILTENIKHAFPLIVANFYGNPSQALKSIAVTGTNGKTTTVNILHQVFSKLGHTAGAYSTINMLIGDRVLEPVKGISAYRQVNSFLRKILDANGTHFISELTSAAIEKENYRGMHYSGAIFTNLTQDHLDYHGSMEAYFAAKKKLFDYLSPSAFALVNADDSYSDAILADCKAKKYSFSLQNPNAGFYGKLISESLQGITLEIEGRQWQFSLRGRFNAYNLMAVYGAAVLLGENKENVLQALQTVIAPKGRLEVIQNNKGVDAFVDFAHTPDGLEKVLETIKNIKQHNTKIILVAGCGGNKDQGKRPIMGKIAVQNSDITIFTADNPRYEDPVRIIEAMMSGLTQKEMGSLFTEPDRKLAIEKACQLAKPGDIILVAGKGHEETQEINGEKFYFSDQEVLKKLLGTV
jgi:UDP-N-acetylmuramoyl-L-alanyl-D-glutamate--2,6-diaminopimelate ligase